MQRNQRGTTTMKEMVMRSRKQTLTSKRMGMVEREVIRKGMVARVARKVMRKGTVTRKGMRRGTATRVGLGMREGTTRKEMSHSMTSTRTLTMPRQNWQWKETATRKGMVVRKGHQEKPFLLWELCEAL